VNDREEEDRRMAEHLAKLSDSYPSRDRRIARALSELLDRGDLRFSRYRDEFGNTVTELYSKRSPKGLTLLQARATSKQDVAHGALDALARDLETLILEFQEGAGG
jgi:hypothetical protein